MELVYCGQWKSTTELQPFLLVPELIVSGDDGQFRDREKTSSESVAAPPIQSHFAQGFLSG
jgi:hypothetical protein